MNIASSYAASHSDEIPSVASQTIERRWERAYLIMYILYIAVGLGARLLGWWYGDAIWFVQAARHVLDGSFDLYSFKMAPEIAPPLGITYSYSPLMAMVIAPFVGVADALGLENEWAYRLMGIPLVLVDVLAMRELRRLVRTWRPLVDERFLFLGIAISLFLTSFWLVTAYRGHIEGMVLLFLLLTLRLLPRNLLLGGLCAGLALSSKQFTSLMVLIPIGLVLLLCGRRPNLESTATKNEEVGNRNTWLRRLRDTLIWSGTALGVFAAFMLLPILRNPDAVWYAMVTMPQHLVMLGPGLPRWINWTLISILSPTDYQVVRDPLVFSSNAILVALVVLISAAVIWVARKRGRPISFGDTRLLGLIALGEIMFILFSKWVSDHYYQLPLALLFIWDIVRTTPRLRNPLPGVSAFPWVGIGAAIAYKSLTQMDPTTYPHAGKYAVPWLGDLLLFFLFLGLAVIIVRGITRQRHSSEAE